MAHRELRVIEIREVLRRFCLGQGLRAIARGDRERPEDHREVRGRRHGGRASARRARADGRAGGGRALLSQNPAIRPFDET